MIKLTELVDNLDRTFVVPSIYYFGIGTAYWNDKLWETGADQQFPLFLRQFHRKHVDIPINLILVDPDIDKIFCIEHHDVVPVSLLEDTSSHDDTHAYHENVIICNENITIWKINEPIHYLRDDNNVDNIFRLLNTFVVSHNSILVVHDFCGNDIVGLNRYFMSEISKHPKNLFYDLSNGFQCGCYMDLCDPSSQLIFDIENNLPVIRYDVCNIFLMKLENVKQFVGNDKHNENKIIRKKVYIFVKMMEHKLKILYFTNKRRAHSLKNAIVTKRDVDICKRVFRDADMAELDSIHSMNLSELLKQNKIDEFTQLVDYLFNYQLDLICSVMDLHVDKLSDNIATWNDEFERNMIPLHEKIEMLNPQK